MASPLAQEAVTIEAELLPPGELCVGACAAVLACLDAKAFPADVESRTEERSGGEGGVVAVDEEKGLQGECCAYFMNMQATVDEHGCLHVSSDNIFELAALVYGYHSDSALITDELASVESSSGRHAAECLYL